jgi:class 3 adenylate cyclase
MRNKQHTILIVENEADQARGLAKKLEGWGYSVLKTAATAREAIELAQHHNPHLVLMDIRLAGSRNGISAARAIRRNGGYMPIVFLTAYDNYLPEASKVGFFSFLDKNHSDLILRQTVMNAIEHFSYTEQLAEVRSARTARMLEDKYIRKLISPEVFESLKKRPHLLKPQHSNVAVGFVDIRGYTKLSNTIQIEQMNTVLEHYFTSVCCAVAAHKGFVDKFIGDAVLWFHHGDDPKPICHAAIAVACDILAGMKDLNKLIKEKSHAAIELNLGIGLAYGQCAVGIFGAPEHRIQYSIIGPPVNLASRMCSFAQKNEICIGGRIIENCKLPMKRVGFKEVKGFEHDVDVRKIVLQKKTTATSGAAVKMQTQPSKGVA